jgi:hypothetical protein
MVVLLVPVTCTNVAVAVFVPATSIGRPALEFVRNSFEYVAMMV